MAEDSEEVRAIARRVRHEAERVRDVATRVGATRSIGWRSPAATRFREAVTDRVGGLLRAARRLETAADAVEAHAVAVDRARQALRALVGDGPGAGGRR